MAAIVPMGIDFWASRRSPERLEPAMIPEQITERQTLSRSTRFMCTNTHTGGPRGSRTSLSFLLSFVHKLSPGQKRKLKLIQSHPSSNGFTRHRGEVDSNQQRKEAGDVSQHVAVCIGQGVVLLFHRRHIRFGDQVSLLVVGPEQVLWMSERESEQLDFILLSPAGEGEQQTRTRGWGRFPRPRKTNAYERALIMMTT